MKIVCLDGKALNPGDLSWAPIEALGDFTVYDQTVTEDQAIARLQGAEALLVNKFSVTETLLAACPTIRLVCVLATGYNVVDCAAARKRGIPVCNVPCYGTAAVAQFTLGLMLTLCHRIEYHSQSVHAGDWTICPDFCYWLTPQMELAGKTLGILGFGRIGQAVAKLGKAFGMDIITCSRTRRETDLAEFVSFEELLRRSDFLTLHCPLTAENTGILNRETIAGMKNGAMLINTARGALVDEQALADALASGKLAGAAVDVACQEPIHAQNPLLTAPNCIITPHIAWAPLESRQRLMNVVADNIRCYVNGHPQNVVN